MHRIGGKRVAAMRTDQRVVLLVFRYRHCRWFAVLRVKDQVMRIVGSLTYIQSAYVFTYRSLKKVLSALFQVFDSIKLLLFYF